MDQKDKSKDPDSANCIRLCLFHFHGESFLLRIKALNTAEADIRYVPPSLILMTHKALYSIEIDNFHARAALICKIKDSVFKLHCAANFCMFRSHFNGKMYVACKTTITINISRSLDKSA